MSKPKTAHTKVDFDAVLKATQSHIRAYIAGMGVPSHEVDDVAQDVYLEFFKNLHKAPAEVAPERWLKGIARNLCMNHFRKKKRRGELHREALVELLAKAESPLDQTFAQGSPVAALESCFDKLPEKSQHLLGLRYRDELSSAAMAEALETSAQAVRVSLHRVRQGLKDCISNTLSRERWK